MRCFVKRRILAVSSQSNFAKPVRLTFNEVWTSGKHRRRMLFFFFWNLLCGKENCICCTSRLFLHGMIISNVPRPSKIVSLNQGYKMILLREPSQVWSKKAIYFHWPSWSSEFRSGSLAHLRIEHCHHACNYSMKVVSRKEHQKGNRLCLAVVCFRTGEWAR